MSAIAPRFTSLITRTAATRVFTPSLIRPATSLLKHQSRGFQSTNNKMSGSFDEPVASLNSTPHKENLPESSPTLFEAKTAKKMTFETLGKELGRSEVAVAGIFYGQVKPSEEDVKKLAKVLDIDEAKLMKQLYGWPDRGRTVPMPPREPMIYRLYEIVQNYGYAYKAVINEKFGDGIMSAITYSTKVEKEVDDKGTWVVITLRGKWLPFTRF